MSKLLSIYFSVNLNILQQNDGSVFSLLSLSIAAASAAPIPVSQSSDLTGTSVDSTASVGRGTGFGDGLNGTHTGSTGTTIGNNFGNAPKQHRRMSSTGRRRRLSDARDAATRPSCVHLYLDYHPLYGRAV